MLLDDSYKVRIATRTTSDLLPRMSFDPVLCHLRYLNDLAIAVIIVRDVVPIRIQVSTRVATHLEESIVHVTYKRQHSSLTVKPSPR